MAVALQTTNAEFILNNWNKIIEIGITTEEKLRAVADTHIKLLKGPILARLIQDREKRRKNAVKYYQDHYVGDSKIQKENRERRNERSRENYKNNEELREKQRIRMKLYRQKKKALVATTIAIAKEN